MNVNRHLWSMAKYVGPVISFKSLLKPKGDNWISRYSQKLMDAALQPNIKFPSLPALFQGKMPSSPNLSQRCWMMNVQQPVSSVYSPDVTINHSHLTM